MFNIIPRFFSDPSQIIVGLEVGSSKVCAAIGELTENGVLTIIGAGQTPSRCARKGEIVDYEKAEEDIRLAIVAAEKSADAEVGSVYLGVTGSHLCSLNNRGVHTIGSREHEISTDDVSDVLRNAKSFNRPTENTVLHAVRQLFTVNGQSGIHDPVGMKGSRLEVDVHVVHGVSTRLQNPAVAVRSLQIEVEELVFNGLAASLALLTREQKENGALVIDMGAGTTEYVVYAGGVIRHTGVIAVGGDHVTNDLSYGLKVSTAKAEALKRKHGAGFIAEENSGGSVTLSNDLGFRNKTINLAHLRRIMVARLEETFQLIDKEVELLGLHDQLRSGVVLSGGGSRIPLITDLAEDVFEMPAAVGTAISFNGLKQVLEQPEYATAIGLVSYGAIRQKNVKRRGLFASGIGKVFGII